MSQGIMSFHKGGGVKHTHGASSGQGSGTVQIKPQTQTQTQTQSNQYYSPGYIAPKDRQEYVTKVIQDGIKDLKNIQDNKEALVQQGAMPAYLKPGHKFYDDMTKKIKDINGNTIQVPIPFDEMDEGQKSIAKHYYNPTYNAYQQQLNDYINTSPINREIYKQDGGTGAGFNLFMTESVPNYIKNNLAFGLLGNLGPQNEYFAGKGVKPTPNYAQLVSEALTPQQAGNLSITQEESDSVPKLLEKEEGISSKGGGKDLGSDSIIDIFDPEQSAAMADADPEKAAMEKGLPSGPGLEIAYNPEADAQNFNYMGQALSDENIANEISKIRNKAGTEQVKEESPVAGQINLAEPVASQDNVVLSGDPKEILDTKVDEDEDVVMPGDYPDPSYLMQEDLYNPLDNQPYINKTFDDDDDPTVLGGDENIPPGTVFSPNVVGQTPVLPFTFPGLEPTQNAAGGYLQNFDDGGYASMSTYQKLKMMADSLGK